MSPKAFSTAATVDCIRYRFRQESQSYSRSNRISLQKARKSTRKTRVMPKLDIHPASETERIAAYRNVHDVWSGGLDLEAHVARRLQSVQHNRADWFVGTLDGDVVTSLACYPLMFQLDGDSVPGIALGSVHTRADCRRRGFAGELIAWVEEHQQRRGVVLSLLYSDIDPRYYARLGYQECPSNGT